MIPMKGCHTFHRIAFCKNSPAVVEKVVCMGIDLKLIPFAIHGILTD